MKLELWKKPKGATIIEGFPGFGLVGPITTEFLISHLKTEQIGQFVFDELPAMVAIHQGKTINPMAVHYSKQYNIILFHTILNVKGFEWKFAQEIADAADDLKAKEIICLEGVNVIEATEQTVFGFNNPRFFELGAQEMRESVILGVSAALLLRAKNVSCLFAQAHSSLPDSKAAADIISFLDKYLGLHVDPAPLVEQAELFEAKLKGMLAQAQVAEEDSEKKNLSYLG